uniref:Uncharacterized protein n=1 Tax=Rhizophora mucronata TaxID=61149 RepID=A0A2P2NC81_RHIMU
MPSNTDIIFVSELIKNDCWIWMKKRVKR